MISGLALVMLVLVLLQTKVLKFGHARKMGGPIIQGSTSGEVNWDIPTTFVPSIVKGLPPPGPLREKAVRDTRRQTMQELSQVHAKENIFVIESLPGHNKICELVVPRISGWTPWSKKDQIQHVLKHLRAWDVAISNNPSAKQFLVLEGDFDFGVAPFWDSPLSTLVEQANTEVPEWEVISLTQAAFLSPKAWECGLRFARISDAAQAYKYNFDAYVVNVRDSTLAWLKPYQEWREGLLTAEDFAGNFTLNALSAHFLTTFNSFHTTVRLLHPGKTASNAVRDFWLQRNRLPCRNDSSTKSAPDLASREKLPAQSASQLPCQFLWPGPTSSSLALAPPSHCGSRWDVPAFFINMDSATGRREKMEFQTAKLAPTAPIQRAAALSSEHSWVAQLFDLLPPRAPSERVEVAVSLSHLSAIDRGAREFPGHKYIVVMEDDLVLDTVVKWELALSELLERADKEAADWEILNLACSNWHFFQGWDQCRLTVHPYETDWHSDGHPPPIFMGLVMYAVKLGPALDRLLQPFRSFATDPTSASAHGLAHALLSMPADWMLYQKLKAYVTTMPLGVTSGAASQISPGRESNHALKAEDVSEYWESKLPRCQYRGDGATKSAEMRT